jgi:hypothetical protein
MIAFTLFICIICLIGVVIYLFRNTIRRRRLSARLEHAQLIRVSASADECFAINQYQSHHTIVDVITPEPSTFQHIYYQLSTNIDNDQNEDKSSSGIEEDEDGELVMNF